MFSGGNQPQRGFTAKPGVAVTTAHPRNNRTRPCKPQRGSTSPMPFFWVQVPEVVEPRWGSGQSRFPDLGCAATQRPQALLWNPFRVESHDFPRENPSRRGPIGTRLNYGVRKRRRHGLAAVPDDMCPRPLASAGIALSIAARAASAVLICSSASGRPSR